MIRGREVGSAPGRHPGSGRGGLLGPFAMAVAVSASIVVTSPAAAQLQAPEVKSVSFVGNEAFPSDSLARAIAIFTSPSPAP